MIQIKKLFDLGSDFGRRTTAERGLYFEPVKLIWIVRGGDHYTANRTELFNAPGNNRCWLCFAKQGDAQSIAGNNLGSPLREKLGQEPPVVAHHHQRNILQRASP